MTLLTRRDPFRNLESLHREMSQLFDTLTPWPVKSDDELDFMPAAELKETPEAVELKLELPGLEAKDLEIEVTENSVSISGERKSETKTQENGMTRSEFRYGRFQRMLPLPARVVNDQTTANYKDGILKLVLPKSDSERQKTFKVELS